MKDIFTRRIIFPDALVCERCGRLIYEGDDYRRDGYGGYLCSGCIEELDYNDNEEDEDDG